MQWARRGPTYLAAVTLIYVQWKAIVVTPPPDPLTFPLNKLKLCLILAGIELYNHSVQSLEASSSGGISDWGLLCLSLGHVASRGREGVEGAERSEGEKEPGTAGQVDSAPE